MTALPTPVVRSGRRLGAGPGHHALGLEWLNGRPIAALLVISVAMAMMAAPGIVATLSMILGDRLDGPGAPWPMPFDVALVIESGRILLTLALATVVTKATEQE
jgi:hypothetical protein